MVGHSHRPPTPVQAFPFRKAEDERLRRDFAYCCALTVFVERPNWRRRTVLRSVQGLTRPARTGCSAIRRAPVKRRLDRQKSKDAMHAERHPRFR